MTRKEHLIGFYIEDYGVRYRVQVEMELADGRLSITGTSGEALADGTFRMRGGDPVGGSGGQCVDEVRRVDEFAPGWDAARRDRLVAIWDRWHLNDMQAGCVHQRRIADRLGREPHQLFATPFTLTHPDRTSSYDAMHGKQITHARVFCPICGYGYGSAWLREELPANVVAFVAPLTS